MSKDKTINFMGLRKVAATFSILLIVISIASLAYQGLNFGLDFTGGTLVELHYKEPAKIEVIREELKQQGFPSAVVTNFGSDHDVLVRLQASDNKVGAEVAEKLSANNVAQVKQVSYVGPQIGEELRDEGGLGMLAALAVVMLYVGLRFQFKFSVGSVVALAHDVVITLGLFSVLQLDFDLTVLAAILAVIGYSLNDTIVVADRIRENFRIIREEISEEELINISLTQTLSRTLMTSFTTLLVLFALFLFGGESIHNFSVALIAGIVVGTYSSIYVAANILLMMNISRQDLIPAPSEAEAADQDEIRL